MDGARGKWGTILKAITDSKADIWMMQETKCAMGEMKKPHGFTTYEHHRSESGGGSLAICAKSDLNPILVRDGGERVEAITIDIHIKNMAISCTNAYGPQENAKLSKKTEFWKYLAEEASRAKQDGMGFILQGDLNSWLGPEIIPGYIRKQNRNGKLFAQFVENNKLTIVNTLPICKGLITRSRLRQGQLVQSTIDLYVVCQRDLPYISEMIIDDDKKYRLTNYTNICDGGVITEADHKPMLLKVNLKIVPEKPERVEVFDFKSKERLARFKKITSETNDFSTCFSNTDSLLKQLSQWNQTIDKHIKRAFPKIRIKQKHIKVTKANALIDKRNNLAKLNKGETEEAKLLDIQIANILEEEGKSKAYLFQKYCDKNGATDIAEMWKLKKKLWPTKTPALSVAKKSHAGRLVSAPADLKKLLLR